jgi:hypothetical protein
MSQPPQGVKISAYIFFALAVLTLLGMCALVAVLGLALTDTGSMDIANNTVGFGVGACLTLVFAILYAVVGYGLLQVQNWARIAAIVLAILSLCSFPIGTILGGIVLYFMFQPETQQAFS